jgi:replicative DNA helicase
MVRKKIPVDVLTVRDYIDSDEQPLSRSWAVDFQFLALLSENSTGTHNIEVYAKHIREARIKNEIDDLKKEINYDNYQETVSQIQSLELDMDSKNANSVFSIVGKTIDYLENPNESGFGLSSGFDSLDALLSGFKTHTLTVVAGRPSMGKSTLALNIADHVSQSKNVLFFSLEMSQVQLMLKIVSSRTSIPLSKIDRNQMSESEQVIQTNEDQSERPP